MSGNTFPAFGARRSTIFGKNQKLLDAVPLRGRVYLNCTLLHKLLVQPAPTNLH
ncbi:hypothetical protein [Microseira wollei]|uniref:hypothetical protein n=1 Tax=Microseira wollei TaxID=467598 RepID=UPI001CFF336E|nr:hypothetical protein [Microseira wollei]